MSKLSKFRLSKLRLRHFFCNHHFFGAFDFRHPVDDDSDSDEDDGDDEPLLNLIKRRKLKETAKVIIIVLSQEQ